jgi:hypothetical protein
VSITHAFVSAKADGADTTLVRPSDWNDEHVGNAGPHLDAMLDFGALGDDSTDDTGALQDAIDAAILQRLPLFIPNPPSGAYKITAALDARANGLHIHGASREYTIIKQYTANTPILKVGHRFQHISDLYLTYDSMPVSTDTSANAVELYKAYWSTYERLLMFGVGRGVYVPQAAYAGYDATTTNGYFSCGFNDIRITGFAINAIHTNNFGGGGTGSLWNNTYISNNPFGSRLNAAGSIIDIRIYDEMVFNQLNVEWGLCQAADAMIFETIGGVVINGLHFEQISLESSGHAFVVVSDGAKAIIDGLTLSTNQITNAGTHALVRTFGECHVDIRGLRQHDNTVAGTFVALNASGATASVSSARFAQSDMSLFTANVANEKTAPGQMLREVNGDIYVQKIGGKVETYGTAAPSTGTWAVGDRVWNTAPAAGGTPGWVCTTAGTPGTWKALANLAA